LEVIGDLVLESGGRVELPLGELLLQAIARDLAQRLQTRGGLEANREGKTAALPLSGSGRRIRRIGGRKVPCGKERKNSSWWGLGSGSPLVPFSCCRRERNLRIMEGGKRQGREGKGRAGQGSPEIPLLGFDSRWMLPFSFLLSISLSLSLLFCCC
jgi:hypothetical protein